MAWSLFVDGMFDCKRKPGANSQHHKSKYNFCDKRKYNRMRKCYKRKTCDITDQEWCWKNAKYRKKSWICTIYPSLMDGISDWCLINSSISFCRRVEDIFSIAHKYNCCHNSQHPQQTAQSYIWLTMRQHIGCNETTIKLSFQQKSATQQMLSVWQGMSSVIMHYLLLRSVGNVCEHYQMC